MPPAPVEGVLLPQKWAMTDNHDDKEESIPSEEVAHILIKLVLKHRHLVVPRIL